MELEGKPNRVMQIGEFAEKAGVSVRAVRYYEELGLLKPEGHSHGGFRLYGEDNVKRIRVIGFLKELGLSLDEISGILLVKRRSGSGREAVEALQRALRDKLDLVDTRLQALGRMKRELEGTLRILRHCECCEREILLEGDRCSGCASLSPRETVPGTFEVILQ